MNYCNASSEQQGRMQVVDYCQYDFIVEFRNGLQYCQYLVLAVCCLHHGRMMQVCVHVLFTRTLWWVWLLCVICGGGMPQGTALRGLLILLEGAASEVILCSQRERPQAVVGAEACDPERGRHAVFGGRIRKERGAAVATAPPLIAEWAFASADVGHTGGVHPRAPVRAQARAFAAGLCAHGADVGRQASAVQLLLQSSALGVFRGGAAFDPLLCAADIHRTRGGSWRAAAAHAGAVGAGLAEVLVDNVHLWHHPSVRLHNRHYPHHRPRQGRDHLDRLMLGMCQR